MTRELGGRPGGSGWWRPWLGSVGATTALGKPEVIAVNVVGGGGRPRRGGQRLSMLLGWATAGGATGHLYCGRWVAHKLSCCCELGGERRWRWDPSAASISEAASWGGLCCALRVGEFKLPKAGEEREEGGRSDYVGVRP